MNDEHSSGRKVILSKCPKALGNVHVFIGVSAKPSDELPLYLFSSSKLQFPNITLDFA
jgi:hypothetical protein